MISLIFVLRAHFFLRATCCTVLISRFCQFILAACFFVGRTDVPFLSGDVVLFGYIFDYAPQSFVKDILVHEGTVLWFVRFIRNVNNSD